MRPNFSFFTSLGLFAFAIGYIAFTLSIPLTRMIGDESGYDPGSRAVPLVAALVMAAATVWEMARSGRGGTAAEEEPAPVGLVLLNILISILFIAAFRSLGFILSTMLLLYVLAALNLRHLGRSAGRISMAAGLIAALVYVGALYSLARWITRSLFMLAREHGMLWAREPGIQALSVTVALAVALVVVHFLTRRVQPRDLVYLVQLSVGTTMAIYVVFRMVFLVQLPLGLLNW